MEANQVLEIEYVCLCCSSPITNPVDGVGYCEPCECDQEAIPVNHTDIESNLAQIDILLEQACEDMDNNDDYYAKNRIIAVQQLIEATKGIVKKEVA